ncbi:MAG: hypothetical protein ACRCX2_00780 [Paraclostridium sp.]
MSIVMRVTKYLKNNLKGKVNDSMYMDILECFIILINYSDKVRVDELERLTDMNISLINFMINRGYIYLGENGWYEYGDMYYSTLKNANAYYDTNYGIIDAF